MVNYLQIAVTAYQYFVFRRTLILLMMLCLSAIVGWIVVSIYDRSRPQD